MVKCHNCVKSGPAPFQPHDLRKGHLLVLPPGSVQQARLPVAVGLMPLSAPSPCGKATLAQIGEESWEVALLKSHCNCVSNKTGGHRETGVGGGRRCRPGSPWGHSHRPRSRGSLCTLGSTGRRSVRRMQAYTTQASRPASPGFISRIPRPRLPPPGKAKSLNFLFPRD